MDLNESKLGWIISIGYGWFLKGWEMRLWWNNADGCLNDSF